MPVSCYRRRVYSLGDSSWRSHKFWIFSEIMPNDEWCRPLWASATLPVFRNLATKRWIGLPSGTLFLPKSFLHCRCVRSDFVAKYTSMISLRCYFVPAGSILVSKESLRPDVYTTWKIWKKIVKQLWDEKQNRTLFLDHPLVVQGVVLVTWVKRKEHWMNVILNILIMTKAVQFGHIDEYEVIKHIKNLTLVNTSLDAAITTCDHCATNIIIVKNNVRMIDSSKN